MNSLITDLEKTLTQAREYEINKDYEAEIEVLSSIWSNLAEKPQTVAFSIVEKADTLRVCGHLLSNLARSKNIGNGTEALKTKKNYQERAKDMLTESVNLFDDLAVEDDSFLIKSAEAKSKLAACYWFEGDYTNAEAYWSDSIDVLSAADEPDLLLQVKINRLIAFYYSGRLAECLAIIGKIESLVRRFASDRVKVEFYNQAGIILRRTDDYDSAIIYYEQALAFSKKIESPRLIAQVLNNLAYAYNLKDDFKSAAYFIEKAIKVFQSLEDRGFVGDALDTLANIEMRAGSNERALQVVGESISLLRENGDAASLANSIWTEVKILLKLERREDAVECFCELDQICVSQISESIAEEYRRKFAKFLVVPIKENTFPSRIKFYEARQEIRISPDYDYLLFIPDFNGKPIIAAVRHGVAKNTVAAYLPNMDIVVGELKIDKKLNLHYILADNSQILDFRSIGTVIAVAEYSDDVLIFENI